MISYKPTVQERIRQGGVIGYIIIVIGIVGILFAFFKYIWLFVISIKVKRQLKNLDTKISNNPLGRIINIYNDNKNLDATDLEYRIDEALYKETPTLQGGFSMIKLFAAASPLLGLLGTVTGMILTFQSITMFGTSDPKLMAGGISQALVTTMLGLSVAIPLLFAHTVLNSKAKKIINILEQQSLSLIAKRLN
jgi:biopolymer transport protein ExbB